MRKYSSESGAWSKVTSVAVVVPSGIRHVVRERLPRSLSVLPEGAQRAGLAPVEVRPPELELARADACVVSLLLLGVERTKPVNDHLALDGEPEWVLADKRECLAGIDHRGNGDAADGVRHDVQRREG